MTNDQEESTNALATRETSELMAKPAQLISRGLEDLRRIKSKAASAAASTKPSRNKKAYSIVWQEFGVGSAVGKRFWIPDESGCLPFFIDGDNLKKLEDSEPVQLDELMLLRGLLYTFDTEPPVLSPVSEESRSQPLHRLMEGFGFDDLETLVVDAAATVRADHGNWVSYRLLKNGAAVAPNSKRVKADMLTDIAVSLATSETRDDRALLMALCEGIKNLRYGEINDHSWQILLVARLTALRSLGETQELTSFFESYITHQITIPYLQLAVANVMDSSVLDSKVLFGWIKDVFDKSADRVDPSQEMLRDLAYEGIDWESEEWKELRNAHSEHHEWRFLDRKE